jgi:hypothetical protein
MAISLGAGGRPWVDGDRNAHGEKATEQAQAAAIGSLSEALPRAVEPPDLAEDAWPPVR